MKCLVSIPSSQQQPVGRDKVCAALTMRHVAAKVAADDAMPGRALSVIELRGRLATPHTFGSDAGQRSYGSLDVLGNILLDCELSHSLLCYKAECLVACLSSGVSRRGRFEHTDFDGLLLHVIGLPRRQKHALNACLCCCYRCRRRSLRVGGFSHIPCRHS